VSVVLPRKSIIACVILIVDDNLINLKVAARMLSSSAHTCICAQSGKEALEIVKTRPIDIVLMDVQMPDIDGLECTRRIRQMEKAKMLHKTGKRNGDKMLPIIAVTASEGSEMTAHCLAAGMDSCIFKPCSRAQLLRMVDEHRRGRKG